MLTELALIFSVEIAGLLFAAMLARWALARRVGAAELRRLAAAATRACSTFLWRENRQVAIQVAAVGGALALLHGYFAAGDDPRSTLHAVIWNAIAAILGAALTCAVAYASAHLALRAAVRSVGAARVSLDHAIALCVRAGGVVGVLADALSVLGATALLGLSYLLGGGPAQSGTTLAATLSSARLVLPGLGLGAVTAALVLQLTGTTYYVSAQISSTIGGETSAGLEENDPRNPALVADLIGTHVGLVASRTVDAFVGSTLANIAAVLIGIVAFDRAPGLWGLITLPLVVRALGILSCGFGLITARAAEAQNPARALWRGQITTVVIALGSLAGAALWLMGDSVWLPLLGAGGLGLIAAVTVAYAAQRQGERSNAAVREVLEAARAGTAVAVARGLASGLAATWMPVVVMGAALSGAWQLGAHSGLPQAAMFSVTTAVAAMFSVGAYMHALGVLGPITASARAVMATDPEAPSADVERRAHRLDEAGIVASTVSQAFFAVAGCAAALLATAGIAAVGLDEPALAANIPIAVPAVVWSGLLGATLVLWVIGSAVTRASRASRATTLEVDRQLRGFPREGGIAQIPPGHTPRYRAVIDQASRFALQNVGAPTLVALLGPAALGFALNLFYENEGVAAEGLIAYVVVAAATGLAIALAAEGARGALGAAHRANRPRGSSAGFEVSANGNALASLIGSAAAPAAHLAVKAAALSALVIAPLLT